MLDLWLARKFIGQKPTARPRIFGLAVLPMAALVQLGVMSVLIYALSYAGLFMAVIRQGSGAEPADWVFWMGDPAWEQVLAFSFFGLLGGLLGRGFPLLTLIGLVFIFPGFLSIKAMACLFLFERVGGWVWAWWGRRELAYGLALMSMVVAGLLGQVFGQPAQMAVLEVFQPESVFHPQSRYALLVLVVGLGLAVEALINLVSLHFYYLRSSKA
jgi:hypothetical protein